MSRWLMFHPESESLFEETDPEAVMSHLDQGCMDVTDESQYEDYWVHLKREMHLTSLRQKASGQQKVFQRVLLKDQRYPSCLNCLNWNKDHCIEFGTLPPPAVIVFSCVTHWEPDIPF